MATDWESAGLPLPSQGGYSYTRNFGFVRTQMRSGSTRQRRRWKDGNATMSVTFDIPTALLYAFESFVAERQSSWFTMPLVTGENSSSVAAPHSVRIISDASYGGVYGENITATMQVEFYPDVDPVEPPFPVDLQSPNEGQVFIPWLSGGGMERVDYTVIHITCGYSYEGDNWISLDSLDVAVPLVGGGESIAPPGDGGSVAIPLFSGGSYSLDADGVFADVAANVVPVFGGGSYTETGEPSLSAARPTFGGGSYVETGEPSLSGDRPYFTGGSHGP